ncbi:MAG: hypothetical protein ACH37Z_12275 [Anaerolineae bacterium]
MRYFERLLALVGLLACLCWTPPAQAALGDLWEAKNDDMTFWHVAANGQFTPVQSTAVAASANTTLSTAPVLVYIGAYTGNHTFALPPLTTAGAHAHIRLIMASNATGTTGNLTVSGSSDGVTTGNVNTKASITITNTSGDTGAVAWVDCYGDRTVSTNDWFVGVTRR